MMWPYFYGTFNYAKRLFRLKSIRNELRQNYSKNEEKSSDFENVSKLIRHNFHPECEEGLNEQINCELYASYTYFCMVSLIFYIRSAPFTDWGNRHLMGIFEE